MVRPALVAAGFVALLQCGLVGAARNLAAADQFPNVPEPPVSYLRAIHS